MTNNVTVPTMPAQPLPHAPIAILEALRGDDGEMITEMRTSDGMMNATKLCKSAGVQFKDFTKQAKTRKFFAGLAEEMGIKPEGGGSNDSRDRRSLHELYPKLIQVQNGGKHKGSWLHPRAMTRLASSVSTRFSVHVTKWVELAKERVAGVREDYDAAISAIQHDPSLQIEREVRVRLADKLGGVQCHIGVLGEIDLVTKDEVIEIKWVCRALHAVGQVLGHSRSFPEKGRRIHLFGEVEDFSRINMDELRNMCGGMDILITEEVIML